MRSNYKKLGQYIQEVNIRNTDLSVNTLLGVSIQKILIPSIANTIGTDLSKYKVVRNGQFAYGPVTSRNGDKISIALLEDFQAAIISQSYKVFEIRDQDELLPEYLMMWFRRPEFDRYARFMSHGSTRETFDWDEMCEVELPIPSPEKQQEIVNEYKTITNRIALNEKLNQKLEETAQALYKHWFVDFEFPDANGNPFRSSGGQISWSDELDKEIPIGWSTCNIGDLGNVITGKTPSTIDDTNFGNDVPFITIPDMHNKIYVFETGRSLSNKGANTQKGKFLPKESICVSCIGTGGLVVLNPMTVQTNQQINSVIISDKEVVYFHYLNIKERSRDIVEYGSKGSVGVNMNKTEFQSLKLLLPNLGAIKRFHRIVKPLFKLNSLIEQELIILKILRRILLTKMTQVEVEETVL